MPSKFGKSDRDIIEHLQNQIKNLQGRIAQLENRHTTTTDVYAKSSLSQRDLVPGQIIVATDNTLLYCTGHVGNPIDVYNINGTFYTTV